VANEPFLSLVVKLRLILLSVILWLTLTLDHFEGFDWLVPLALLTLVTTGLVATFRVTRKQPPGEGDSATAHPAQPR